MESDNHNSNPFLFYIDDGKEQFEFPRKMSNNHQTFLTVQENNNKWVKVQNKKKKNFKKQYNTYPYNKR